MSTYDCVHFLNSSIERSGYSGGLGYESVSSAVKDFLECDVGMHPNDVSVLVERPSGSLLAVHIPGYGTLVGRLLRS